jgi:hypothetical protein
VFFKHRNLAEKHKTQALDLSTKEWKVKPSTMPNNKPTVSTPTKVVDMDAIEQSWSSPLEARKEKHDEPAADKMRKIRSLLNHNTRHLRGGDWLVSTRSHMTLAVAWNHEHNGKKYGLTVAHPFANYGRTIGDSVFAFDSDENEVQNLDGEMVHKLVNVGTIVSIDMDTDSIIFEIYSNIKIYPLAVALSAGEDQVRKIVLPKPGVIPEPLPYGKQLVMFGAARHGMIGCRVKDVDRLAGSTSTDISAELATQSYETNRNGSTKLSYAGNCGALYLDEDGVAWRMHTTIQGVPTDIPKVWTSRGAMLQHIVEAHRFLLWLHSTHCGWSFEIPDFFVFL